MHTNSWSFQRFQISRSTNDMRSMLSQKWKCDTSTPTSSMMFLKICNIPLYIIVDISNLTFSFLSRFWSNTAVQRQLHRRIFFPIALDAYYRRSNHHLTDVIQKKQHIAQNNAHKNWQIFDWSPMSGSRIQIRSILSWNKECDASIHTTLKWSWWSWS